MLKALQQVRAAVSMLSPNEVARRAGMRLNVQLVARDDEGYMRMAECLMPLSGHRLLYRAGDPAGPRRFDIVLCEQGVRCPPGGVTLDGERPQNTLAAIAHSQDDIGLALARWFLLFRKPAVERIVHAVARENALFALTTALPNVVPSLLELPWAMGEFASDTAFLTVNQVRMAFLIAAACGHEVGFSPQKGEILTIGAGAFGWRALAREVAGKMPFGTGLIPKAAIAYAGTYVIGKGLEALHYNGEKHTREETRALYHAGYERGAKVAEEAMEKR